MSQTSPVRGVLLAAVVAGLLLAAAPEAHAITYYWDDNAAGTGFGTAGASLGTWAAPAAGTTAGWSTSSTGANAFAAVTTGTADALNFGTNTATFGLAAGTITVSGAVNANSLTFGSQSGAILLSGGTSITLGGTTPTITVNNTQNTISTQLLGVDGLIKAGTGTLTLTGANLYTGTTTINGGMLQVGNGTAGSLNGTTVTALTFGGTGSFIVSEANNVSQGMGTLTFSAGNGTITSTNNGGTSSLTFSSLAARSVGATGNFVLSGGTAGTPGAPGTLGTNNIVLTTGATASQLIDRGLFYNGSAYAAYDAAGFVRGLAYGTDTNAPAAIVGGGTLGVNDATKDVKITGDITAQTAASVNTINLGANNFTIGSGTLNVNGLLSTGGSAATFSGGTIRPTSDGGESVIRVDGSSDQLTVSSVIGNKSGGLLASPLIKTGAGTLVLSTGNTYTGQTYVNGGTLTISANFHLGNAPTAATLNLNAATLRTTASVGLFNGSVGTNDRQMVISNGATINAASGTTFTTNGKISGTGGLTLTGAGTFAFGSTGSSLRNTFTGGITVDGSVFTMTKSGNLDGGNSTGLDGYFATSNVLTLRGASFTSLNTLGSRQGKQTFAGLVLGSGDNLVAASNSGTSPVGLYVNGITRSGSSTLNVTWAGNLLAGFGVTTTTANTNLILGPWATFGTGTATQYAVGNGAGTAISGLAGTSATDGSNLGTDTTGTFNYALGTFGGSVPATVNANTIRYAGAAGTTSPGATLFQVNGLLNAGTGLWTIDTGTLTIGSTNELVVNAANAAVTISASITGGGASGGFTKTGASDVTLSSTSNAYIGATTINAGTLILGASGGVIPDASDVTIATGRGLAAILNLNGNSETIGGLNGSGTVTSTGSPTLTVGFSNVANATFSGVIQNGVLLTKTGTGTQILSGANTYTGATQVNAGTLLANGQTLVQSATGTNTVTVNGGATAGTLGGNGRVAGAVTVNSGTIPGTITAGTGTGATTLNLGSTLNLADGARYRTTIFSTGSGDASLLNVAGNVTLGSSTGAFVTLNLSNVTPSTLSSAYPSGTNYTIISTPGTLSATNLTIDYLNSTMNGFSNSDFSLSFSNPNTVVLAYNAVPEPGTILGLSAGLLGFCGYTRRRRMRVVEAV